MNKAQTFEHRTGLEIAVIGMAGRFPKADTVAQFWENVKHGIECITFFSDQELRDAGIDQSVLSDPNYVRAKAVLENVEMFDAQFFGINPREAEIMDPQQRIFLECAWEGLENSGYYSPGYHKPIGVYAGVGANTYIFNLVSRPEIIKSVGHYQTLIGNDKDLLATRVSYKLDLTGPSIAVQTACSTSLVAVHLACQALLSGECSMALAGGVAATFPQKTGYHYQQNGISSPDGHCRAFDHKAQGTVGGNGVGVVVLKRLEDALRDRDSIMAVIKGSAINNDGALKVGFTAPSIDGQAAVIRAAQMMAEVLPETIGYVEAHGTGTTLGDPIEVAALTRAFRAGTERRQFCGLGSVKSNIGHLDAAAGVAGLIKTVLALRHKQLPPSLHFECANAELKLAESPFYVNTELKEWPSEGQPRRAGVSSFGIGGTNAHVILEEAPVQSPSNPSPRPYQLLTLSAKTELALARATANLIAYLKANPDTNLADVAYTLQTGRGAFEYRRVVTCQSVDDAVQLLEKRDPRRVQTGHADETKPFLVMMFPGQGTQYVGMGRQLYENESVFREEIDRCAELLRPALEEDLREILYAEGSDHEAPAERLKQTAITQPALFVIEYGLAQLWRSWGVQPDAMIGHSLGEYVAACLAGVMSLEEALNLVAVRGRLMQSLRPGAMLALSMSESEARVLLREFEGAQLSLAAVNSPSLSVLSGDEPAIQRLEQQLSEKGLWSHRLQTSHAFHSQMMEPILPEFAKAVSRTNLRAPLTPFISNLSGKWITPEEATNPAYWVRHLRETVLFDAGVRQLLANEGGVFLEVGPGQTLTSLLRQQPRTQTLNISSSLRHEVADGADTETMLHALGRMWLAGAGIAWDKLCADESRSRIPLPTYPFERERYWIDHARDENSPRPKSLTKQPDIAEWFYAPIWKQSLPRFTHDLPDTGNPSDRTSNVRQPVLLFADEGGLGAQMARRLRVQGHEVIVIVRGEHFRRLNDQEYVIDAQRRQDYESLFREQRLAEKGPLLIAHLWSVSPAGQHGPDDPALAFERAQDSGFYSLLFLTQALEAAGVSGSVRLFVVTSEVQIVTGAEVSGAEKATVLGLCRVIPQEYANVVCCTIDIEAPEPNTARVEEIVTQLLTELAAKTPEEKSVAFRGKRRWEQTFENARVKNERTVNTSAAPVDGQSRVVNSSDLTFPARLRRRGVYLLTGGTGHIGLELGKYLASCAQARLILVGRTQLPERTEWAEWIATHGEDDPSSYRLSRIQEIEAAGGEVLTITADVCIEAEMREAVRQGRERFGSIDGVIHAAGSVGDKAVCAISETGYAESEDQFKAKVFGVMTLEKVFRDHSPDFYILMSSLSSVLGGLGFAAYSAANSFLDAFAQQQSRSTTVPWISVNWDGWQFAPPTTEVTGTARSLVMTPEEGVDVFERLLWMNGLSQVIVSTGDLQARIDRWIKREPQSVENRMNETPATALHARPTLQSDYCAPENEIEQTIAEFWQTLLGIEEVGIHDSFFELGGHSLLATQLMSRLRETFHVELSLRSFFESPTIFSIAQIVMEGTELKEARELEEVLNRIEGLTSEEVEAALAHDSQ